MKLEAVEAVYRRLAPLYDKTFGLITRSARKSALRSLKLDHGRILEVGVGTGLSLSGYRNKLTVTGIDYSEEMLEKARRRVAKKGLSNIEELRRMDARTLEYPDGSFDVVVAMYIVSVVPEPERVVQEMARVVRPGGYVLILNHFARERGLLAFVERVFAPFADVLGFHSDFSMERILCEPSLELVDSQVMPPLRMFTLLRLLKRPDSKSS